MFSSQTMPGVRSESDEEFESHKVILSTSLLKTFKPKHVFESVRSAVQLLAQSNNNQRV